MSSAPLHPKQKPYIRRATLADSPALSRICLLTGAAGHSAAASHTFGELPGLMYAEPYVHMGSAAGFVLVDPQVEGGGVVGYVLTAFDTQAFEREMEAGWFPQWRAKYPHPYVAPVGDTEDTPKPKEADVRFITTIHAPHTATPAQLAFSPAHLHIDILPSYQRQGWGRALIGRLVGFLKEEKGLEGVWLGMDPNNLDAGKFYRRLGFGDVEGAPETVLGLKFADWKD